MVVVAIVSSAMKGFEPTTVDATMVDAMKTNRPSLIALKGPIPFLDVVKINYPRVGSVRHMWCVDVSPIISLSKEVIENIYFYSKTTLIFRLFYLWPSLLDLHLWITNHWSPLVSGSM